MSPIGKAMLSTVLIVIAVAIYVGVLGSVTLTNFELAQTVLRIVPAIAGLGAIVMIWKSAMSGS